MAMRSFRALVLLAASLFCGTVWAEDVQVHTLSMKVSVDGKVVMTPNLQMLPDVPAYISYTAEGEDEPTYSLEVTVAPDLKVGTLKGTGVEALLYKGAFSKSKPVVDSAILLELAGKATEASSQTVKLVDAKGVNYVIEIVSHAVFMKDASTIPAKTAACVGTDGKINSLAKAAVAPDAGTNRRAAECCGGPCENGGGSMQCCGAIACCVCGTCCVNPGNG